MKKGGRKTVLSNPKFIFGSIVLFIIIVFIIVWALFARLSADDALAGPTECTLGTYSQDTNPTTGLHTGLSQRAYEIEVLTSDGKPSVGKSVSVSTTYVKNLSTSQASGSGVIAEGLTDSRGKIELRVPYCLATVNNSTKFFLGNGSAIFVGDLVIKVDGFPDKVIKNSLFSKGFTPDQYKSFINVSGKSGSFTFKEPKSPSAASSKPNSTDSPLLNPSQISNIGNTSYSIDTQSADLGMTVVGTIKDPKKNKVVNTEWRLPYSKIEVNFSKAPSGNKKVPYYYYLKYTKDSSPMFVKKIFVWKYTDSTKKNRKIIAHIYLTYPFKGSQDFQAESYFKGQLNLLDDNIRKYLAKNPSLKTGNSSVAPASTTNSVDSKKTTNTPSSNSSTSIKSTSNSNDLMKKVSSWLAKVLGK